MSYNFIESKKQDISFDNDLTYKKLLDITDDYETSYDNKEIKPVNPKKLFEYNKIYNIILIFIIVIIIIIFIWFMFGRKKNNIPNKEIIKEYVIVPSLTL